MAPLPSSGFPFWRLLRPRQWTKNAVVLAALLFARQWHDPDQVVRALGLAAAFCLASSAGYVFNDLKDREGDRRHPRTRLRPLASGAIRRTAARWLVPALAGAALLVAWGAGAAVGARWCLVGYLGLSAAYSLRLKRIAMVDVMTIAAGFVLRAAAGALAIGVAISPWLLICTALLALLLALAKRRMAGVGLPPALGVYTPALLDQMIAVVTSCTLMAYILYTFSERTAAQFPSHLMPLTSTFVLFGIFRYLHLVYARGDGAEPETVLLRDRPMQVNLVLYVAAVFLAVRG